MLQADALSADLARTATNGSAVSSTEGSSPPSGFKTPLLSDSPPTPGFLSRNPSFADSSAYQEDWEIMPPLDRLTVFDLLDSIALPQRLEQWQNRLQVQAGKVRKQREKIRLTSLSAKDRVVEEWRRRLPPPDEQLDRYRKRMRDSVDRVGARWNDTKAVTAREKLSFIAGVLNIFISGYLIGAHPDLFFYWFTVQLCYFMPIRYYTYHKRGYHYFLADLCYFVNLLTLLAIWVAPHSKRLFISTYCLAYGNNAVAIAMWRNSMVFHSLDKVTSLFIHIMPPVTLHCLVHLTSATLQKERFPAIYAIKYSPSDSPEHYSLWAMMVWATVPYAVWQLAYHFLITVRRREKIAAGRPTSFTWLRKSYAKTWIGRLVLTLPDSLQEPAFMLVQYGYALVTMVPCPLWFWYRWLSAGFLLSVFTWSIYNGATYYIDVFGTRFQKELDQLKKDVSRWQTSPEAVMPTEEAAVAPSTQSNQEAKGDADSKRSRSVDGIPMLDPKDQGSTSLHVADEDEVRTGVQLGALTIIVFLLVFLLDNRFRVLPDAIHNHLPLHHPGLVITDVSLASCSSLNLLSSCKLDAPKWHRIEKDLYLNKGWLNHAYIHIERKGESELVETDRVIFDVKVGRLDPTTSEKGSGADRWESRPGGIWIKRSAKRHASDSAKAITAVDVLFGADAVEARPGWEVLDQPILLSNPGDNQEARLTVRRGPPVPIERPIPRVRKDGRFKIMQVADLHLSTGLGVCRDPEPPSHNGGRCDADVRTLEFLGSVLDSEKPDLVVLSGDQVNGETSPDAQSAVFKFAEMFIKRSIPFATIFGNHDDEGSLSRQALMELTQNLPYSLSLPGPSSVEGVGNYYIEVLAHGPRGASTNSALTLYLLDTHGYSPDERQFRGYDWLKKSQIDWFQATAQSLRNSPSHTGYKHIHMDMAFIHIPLPEYRQKDAVVPGSGVFAEAPTAPGFNSGFKQALVEEGVLAVSCGHDHVNDYCALSRSEGPDSKDAKPDLWMCYAGGAGFGGYGGYKDVIVGGYHRRVRVFEFDMDEARIRTWKRLEYGDTEKRVDEMLIAEAGNVVAP
ncbi:MAG: hypothetical protein LQ344_001030 [Seirophora lacunosa]|nr:MAG: hypothetical protein LQ344_001030 [Seirophora lacunosa]